MDWVRDLSERVGRVRAALRRDPRLAVVRQLLSDLRRDPRVAVLYARGAAVWLARRLTAEVGLAATALAFVLVALALFLGVLPRIPSTENPDTFLATSITILATVFAIVVSVALLGVQLIMGSFAPSVAKQIGRITKNWPTLLLYWFFSFGILYNLTLLVPPSRQSVTQPGNPLLTLSYVVTFACFVYLAFFLVYIVRTLEPEHLIDRFAAGIDADFAANLKGFQTSRYLLQELALPTNPLGQVEQLAFRATERGERRGTYYALLRGYLPAGDLVTKDNQSDVESFFASSLSRLAWRALSSRNPEICRDIVVLGCEVTTRLRERGIPDPSYGGFFGFSDALEQIGLLAIQEGFPSVIGETVSSLARLIQVEAKTTLPKTDGFFDHKGREDIGEAAYQDRISEHIRWRDFCSRINYMSTIGRESVRKGYIDVANQVDFVLGDFARLLANLSYRDHVKSWPFHECLEEMVELETALIDSKLERYLHSSLEILWDLKGLDGVAAMNASIRTYTHAIDNRTFVNMAIWQLGYLGRVACDSRLQDVVDAVGERLATAARSLQQDKLPHGEDLFNSIRRELESLIKWSSKQQPPLSDRGIKNALSDFPSKRE